MSSTWLDEAEMESAEYDESSNGELYDEGESEDYGEESRSSAARRRRAQQRRIALRRQQELARRARTRPGAVPARPSTAAAIRTLDLENKVHEDRLRSTNTALNKRMSRSEYAAVVGAATNQFIESFDEPDNPYFRAGLRFAPLLLLSPQRRGTGFGAFVMDPRVIGAAAVGAIVFASEHRDKILGPKAINILAADKLAAGESDRFVAEVVDGSGKVLTNNVAWASDDEKVAMIDPQGGVKAVKAGTAIIKASYDGVVRQVRLKVS